LPAVPVFSAPSGSVLFRQRPASWPTVAAPGLSAEGAMKYRVPWVLRRGAKAADAASCRCWPLPLLASAAVVEGSLRGAGALTFAAAALVKSRRRVLRCAGVPSGSSTAAAARRSPPNRDQKFDRIAPPLSPVTPTPRMRMIFSVLFAGAEETPSSRRSCRLQRRAIFFRCPAWHLFHFVLVYRRSESLPAWQIDEIGTRGAATPRADGRCLLRCCCSKGLAT